MEVDEYSFKKPGAIPFKWEIRPGVPKLQQLQKYQPLEEEDEEFSFPETSRKLAPPPAGYHRFQPPIESRTGSFRSAPRSGSKSFRLNYSSNNLVASVSSNGCFPSPNLLIRKSEKYKTKKPTKPNKADLETEMDSSSDLDTLSRWSVSSGKSLSPFRDFSPLSSSFSSFQSTPPRHRLVNDAEWAGFGLF